MNIKKQIINKINSGIVTKLVPSSIAGAGVGVIALTEIYQNEIVFAPKETHFIQWDAIKLTENNVIRYIKQVCNHNENGFWIDCDINDIGAAYFVNHSDDPNLEHNKQKDIYFAIKDIKIGEELTCKYFPDEIDWV